MDEIRIASQQCIGSGLPALHSDLLPLEPYSRARCRDCGAKVGVWFAFGQCYRRGHQAGVDTDGPELVPMVRAGVRGAAINLDYNPEL